MTTEEKIITEVSNAVLELGNLKNLEAAIEREKVKIDSCLSCILVRIKILKNNLVRLVANEKLDIQRMDTLCDIIRKLNRILDYEKNTLKRKVLNG